MTGKRWKQANAVLMAVLAAIFYGISTPLSKILLRYVSPTMLAAFLYLGAGIGIGMMDFMRRAKATEEKKLGREDFPYAVAMIVLDIIAPILLMNGMERTTAANVSLLNNFEIVATAVIAFSFFQEKITKQMWMSLFLITVSSLILSFEGTESLCFSTGSMMVVGAAFCWGLENNCTRMIASKSTYEIVILKGFCSGMASLIIALIIGETVPAFSVIMASLLVGFAAYGLSIFAYIKAQEVIGAAKTSAFYALAPFIGAFLSFLLLNEALSQSYVIGFVLMLLGVSVAIRDTLLYNSSKNLCNH